MAVEQPLCLPLTVSQCEGTGNPEGIETVQVAASRQNLRCTEQVAARDWPDIAAIECMQQPLKFVVALHLRVRLGQVGQNFDARGIFAVTVESRRFFRCPAGNQG